MQSMSRFGSKNVGRESLKATITSRATHLGNDVRYRPSEIFGENVFDLALAANIPAQVKADLIEISKTGRPLTKAYAEIVANAVTQWALARGVTHFCHWFQPMTGSTAEKHDSFIRFDEDGRPIEKLGASELMFGEPDASSFPNGGTRSTFEARGYTTWDITSPMFIMESANGSTLCIPTAFVTYNGEALDIKTPLLRSIIKLNNVATRFMNLLGYQDTKEVFVNCGPEQEYFLIDKALYQSRPDLVMTGRTLFGALTEKNQQLEDHYFGTIDERVLAFMQELDYELYKLGIPSKTRHNEVAPGQFELAPIYRHANLANDQNQLVMAVMRKVANRHNFVVLLHEKPFAGINGSGKHVNWSMGDNKGRNLLDPGVDTHTNYPFLLTVAVILNAVHRNADMIRMSIASHGNDHRLGANEAPPSIISIFLGDTLTKIYEALAEGKTFTPVGGVMLDIRATQLAPLFKDNTDRNRTSPFAFTGNKFEFRAVGASQTIGFPVTILNAAVADVMEEVNEKLESALKGGKVLETTVIELIKELYRKAQQRVFNGDGYSQEWRNEAEARGLSNLRTTADAMTVFKDPKKTEFLSRLDILSKTEIESRYNVFLHRYNTHRKIEFDTLVMMVNQYVIPSTVDYKAQLVEIAVGQKSIGMEAKVEKSILASIDTHLALIQEKTQLLAAKLAVKMDDESKSFLKAKELMPISVEIAQLCHSLEEVIPDRYWTLPKYFDMLFIR